MPSPVEAIAAEGAAAVEPAVVEVSGFGVRLRRLIEPSPRSLDELRGDLVAVIVNGAADARTGGVASQSDLGESVADCVYALTGTGGLGGESPLMRLIRSVVRFFTGLRKPRDVPPVRVA